MDGGDGNDPLTVICVYWFVLYRYVNDVSDPLRAICDVEIFHGRYGC